MRPRRHRRKSRSRRRRASFCLPRLDQRAVKLKRSRASLFSLGPPPDASRAIIPRDLSGSRDAPSNETNDARPAAALWREIFSVLQYAVGSPSSAAVIIGWPVSPRGFVPARGRGNYYTELAARVDACALYASIRRSARFVGRGAISAGARGKSSRSKRSEPMGCGVARERRNRGMGD